MGKQNFDEFLRIRKFEIWITPPGIHEKKNIPENVSKLTSLWFKRTKNFVAIRSEM